MLIILTSEASNLLSVIGSMNYFGPVVQKILQSKYLKTILENSEITDFQPTFWNFVTGNFSLKDPVSWTLNAHISKTGMVHFNYTH